MIFSIFYFIGLVIGFVIADHCPARWGDFFAMSKWRALGKGRFIFTWKE